MADALLTLNTTVQTIIETDGGTVFQYVNSNPGSNLAEIVAGTALNQLAVEKILTISNGSRCKWRNKILQCQWVVR
jgi:tRNA A58 N-methylase Trm61